MDGWIDRKMVFIHPSLPVVSLLSPGGAANCCSRCAVHRALLSASPAPPASPSSHWKRWDFSRVFHVKMGVIWVGKTIIKHPQMGMIYTRLYHLWFNSCLQYGTLVRPMPYLLAWLPHLHMVINGQIRKHGVAVNLPDNYNLFWVYSVCTFDSPKRETRANGTCGMLFLGLAAIQKNMKVTPLVPCNHAYIPYQLELPLS